ncbi:hypothetical protein [Asticcacaulis sp.]|uniref:hypothetical protein n=1 Tax=Asticcacaulis sp. TaxID=1872648 RepID=UPI002610302A|nr:hypothetical protein [Asticcacaulis sp.]
MSKIVVSAWSHNGNAEELEAAVPLLFNGRRMRQLGMRNRITVLFLKGWSDLPQAYRDALLELGYDLIDGQSVAKQIEARIPVLVEALSTWGGIRHYGLLRFLVMREMFPGEGIITFDGDMVINAELDEIEAALGDRFYVLDDSSCFISIPKGHDFLDHFRDAAFLWNDDQDAFNRRFTQFEDPADVLKPAKINGTDQGLVLLLLKDGTISNESQFSHLKEYGLIAFANWLMIEESIGRPITYERKNGVDYVRGRKLLVSHLSHDTCAYFGSFLYLKTILGGGDVATLGRVPLPYEHYAGERQDTDLFTFLLKARDSFNCFPQLTRLGVNPFSRTSVIRAFYEEGDFSSILNDRLWYREGCFESVADFGEVP